jgi:hypothetical protein
VGRQRQRSEKEMLVHMQDGLLRIRLQERSGMQPHNLHGVQAAAHNAIVCTCALSSHQRCAALGPGLCILGYLVDLAQGP